MSRRRSERRRVTQAPFDRGVGVEEVVPRVLPDVVGVHELRGIVVVEAGVDRAVLAGGARGLVDHLVVCAEKCRIAGRVVVILHAPGHRGGLIDLRRGPDHVAVGGVLLIPEPLAAGLLLGAIRDIAQEAVDVLGLGRMAGAVEGDRRVDRVPRPDERIRAVVHPRDHAAASAVDVQGGRQQGPLEQRRVAGIGECRGCAGGEPVGPIRLRGRLQVRGAVGVEPRQRRRDLAVVDRWRPRIARSLLVAADRAQVDLACLTGRQRDLQAHPALVVVGARIPPGIDRLRPRRASHCRAQLKRGGQAYGYVLGVVGKRGAILPAGRRRAIGLVGRGHRAAGPIERHRIIAVAAVYGGIGEVVEVGCSGGRAVIGKEHPLHV